MPTDLGNLLIRVTSVGFDEVLQNLENLESVINRIGTNSGLEKISRQLDQMSRYMKDMHGDLAEMTLRQQRQSEATEKQEKTLQQSGNTLTVFDKIMKACALTATTFWTAVSVPKKFIQSMERISAFNLQLSNLALTANITKTSLQSIGSVIEGFGGSKQEIGGTFNRFRRMATNLVTGKPGGQEYDVLMRYGVNVGGTGVGGIGTPEEILRSIAVKFKEFGTGQLAEHYKRDLADQLGLSAAQFKLVNQDLKAFDAQMNKARKTQEDMVEANKAAERVMKARKDLEAAWERLELRMLGTVEPALTKFLNGFEAIVKFFEAHPKIAVAGKAVAAGVTGVGIGATAWKGIKKLFGSGAEKAAANVVGSAGNAAGAAGAVVRTASGFSNWLGVGVGFGNLVANGVTAGKQWQSAETLGLIYRAVQSWFGLWRVMQTSQAGIKINRAELTKELGSWIDYGVKADGKGGNARIVENLVLAWEKNKQYEAELLSATRKFPKTADRQGEGQSVRIGSIAIQVKSDSADALEVAKAVKAEFDRQVSAAIFEARKGVKFL